MPTLSAEGGTRRHDATRRVHRAGTWYLATINTTHSRYTKAVYGKATDTPVAGDWDGDGRDTVGVYRAGTWYLATANTSYSRDTKVAYGHDTDTPVVAAAGRGRADTPAVVADNTWHLRDEEGGTRSHLTY